MFGINRGAIQGGVMNALDKWSNKDAQWWQFWMPQSGMVGGAIFGVVVAMIVLGGIL